MKCDAEFSSRLYDKVIGFVVKIESSQDKPILATPTSLNSFSSTERKQHFPFIFYNNILLLTPTLQYEILFQFEDYVKGKILGSTTGVGIEVLIFYFLFV